MTTLSRPRTPALKGLEPASSGGALARAAGAGDAAAWEALVDRYTGLLWSVGHAFRLSEADCSDVVQTVWQRLAENLHRLDNPECVGTWLATTARHECSRLVRAGNRERPTDVVDLDRPDPRVGPEESVVHADRDSRLRSAFLMLSETDQQLLRVLTASPPPSYADVAAALDMPVGSIGPTRARALARLRATLSTVGLDEQASGSP